MSSSAPDEVKVRRCCSCSFGCARGCLHVKTDDTTSNSQRGPNFDEGTAGFLAATFGQLSANNKQHTDTEILAGLETYSYDDWVAFGKNGWMMIGGISWRYSSCIGPPGQKVSHLISYKGKMMTDVLDMTQQTSPS